MSDTQGKKVDVLTPGAGHSNTRIVGATSGNGVAALLAKTAKSNDKSNPEQKAQAITEGASSAKDSVIIPAGDVDLKFVLEVIPAADIRDRTFVDTKSNGREKELVNSHNVNALTKAIRKRTQLMPAYGVRHSDGLIEILDGQRRSLACYEAGKDFSIYVCDSELDAKLKRELSKELQTAKEISLYDMGIEVNYHRMNSGEDGEELLGKQIALIMGISESAVSRANKAFRTPLQILKGFYDYNLLQVTDYDGINKFVSAFDHKVKLSVLESIDTYVNTKNRSKFHVVFKEYIENSQLDESMVFEHFEGTYAKDDEVPMYEILFAMMCLEFFINRPDVIDDNLVEEVEDESKITVAELHSLQAASLVKGCKKLAAECDKRQKSIGVKKVNFIEEAGAKEWNSSSSNRRFKLTGEFKVDPKTANSKTVKGGGSIQLGNVPQELYEEVSQAVAQILNSHIQKTENK